MTTQKPFNKVGKDNEKYKHVKIDWLCRTLSGYQSYGTSLFRPYLSGRP